MLFFFLVTWQTLESDYSLKLTKDIFDDIFHISDFCNKKNKTKQMAMSYNLPVKNINFSHVFLQIQKSYYKSQTNVLISLLLVLILLLLVLFLFSFSSLAFCFISSATRIRKWVTSIIKFFLYTHSFSFTLFSSGVRFELLINVCRVCRFTWPVVCVHGLLCSESENCSLLFPFILYQRIFDF